jgi:peptidoglycan/LPS O-acetylase OafA/YrhL
MHSGFTFVPGDGGVTVFFCISGYIITTLLVRERQRTGAFAARKFYLRRALKLAPPFLVIVLLPTLVYSARHSVDWLVVLSQILFTYNWAEVLDPVRALDVLPGTTVVWSLAVEEQFYIGFAVVWLLISRRRWWRAALFWLALAAIVVSLGLRFCLALDPSRFEHVALGTDARMEAIAWGVLVAVLHSAWLAGRLAWLRVFGRDLWLLVTVALFVVGSLALRQYWPEMALRPTLHAVATALVILYGLVGDGSPVKRAFFRLVELRLLQVIGLASYSIYLCHLILIELTSGWMQAWPMPWRAVVAMAGTVSVGVLLYYVVERPMLRLKPRLIPGG